MRILACGFALSLALPALWSESRAQGWIRQESGTRESLNGVSCLDVDTGTTVGDRGTILRTVDGGETWVAQDSGTAHNLYRVSLIDPDTAMAVGDSGTILRTTDAGETWVLQDRVMSDLREVYFVDRPSDGHRGAKRDYGGIYSTVDGGETWTRQDWRQPVWDIVFPDAKVGYAIAGGGLSSPRRVARTTDGGQTWHAQAGTGTVRALSFVDANNGTAVGYGGSILHTTTGGE
jgi:photosystem II stability/assembly factor-like uncharacterized protein